MLKDVQPKGVRKGTPTRFSLGQGVVESAFTGLVRRYWILMAYLMAPIVLMCFYTDWVVWVVNGVVVATFLVGVVLRKKFGYAMALVGLMSAYFASLAETFAPGRDVFTVYPRSEWLPIPEAFGICGIFAISILGGWRWSVVALFAAAVVALFHPMASLELVVTLGIATICGLMVRKSMHETARSRAALLALALTDSLTNLGNRRALERDFPRYQAIVARDHQELLLVLWDLDGLKGVNDRYGHASGDAQICSFVEAFQQEAREGDSLYRVGGDEFCSLHVGQLASFGLVERVREHYAYVSAGLAIASSGDLDSSVSQADLQMYQDKRIRRGASEYLREDYNRKAE